MSIDIVDALLGNLRIRKGILNGELNAGSIFGTYITRPTDRKVLEHFYRTTRPFGWWKPLKDCLPADVRERMKKEQGQLLQSWPSQKKENGWLDKSQNAKESQTQKEGQSKSQHLQQRKPNP